MSVRTEKTDLRRQIITERRALGAEKRRSFSARICEKIAALPEFQAASTIAAFAPMPEEVNLFPLLEEIVAEKRLVALPRVIAPGEMSFHYFLGRDRLQPGFKGLLEPHQSLPAVDKQRFDFLLIPSVSIDSSGRRLGYGGGFYDRFLAGLTSVFSCAPLFSCQRRAVLPVEEHDQTVSLAISE